MIWLFIFRGLDKIQPHIFPLAKTQNQILHLGNTHCTLQPQIVSLIKFYILNIISIILIYLN